MPTEIEKRVDNALQRVPDWIWDRRALPVPVEDIADSCFGLLVREIEDLHAAPGVPDLGADTALSGLLLPARREIWVNAKEAETWPARKRFTIGHELGHWCMHRITGAVWCRSSVVGVPQQQDPGALAPPRHEEEANEFAAALLMPAPLLRSRYERLRREDPAGCFTRLCQEFGASGGAMGRRLRRTI
jgi:hypothetical protein